MSHKEGPINPTIEMIGHSMLYYTKSPRAICDDVKSRINEKRTEHQMGGSLR